MPSRNCVKAFVPESYYHIYNRGVNKRVIFKDDEDYCVFLNLLKRYLDKEETTDLRGRKYKSLSSYMELLAYCLMPNHFHLCIYQTNENAITQLLRAVTSSYSTYFNKKYNRIGPLFQGTYKASMILTDEYAMHISRYIHLNPIFYRQWPYSSLHFYLGNKSANWVRPQRLLRMFDNTKQYEKFVADYVGQMRILDELKQQLATY